LILSVAQLFDLLDGGKLLRFQLLLLHLDGAQLTGQCLAGGGVAHPFGKLSAVPDGQLLVWVDVFDGQEEDTGALLIGDQVLSSALVRGQDVSHPVGPVRVLAIEEEHDFAAFFVVNSPKVFSVVGKRVAG